MQMVTVLILGWGTKIPHAVQCGLKQKKTIGRCLLYNLTKYCPLFPKIIFLTDISFVCVYTYILFQMDKYKEKTLTIFD